MTAARPDRVDAMRVLRAALAVSDAPRVYEDGVLVATGHADASDALGFTWSNAVILARAADLSALGVASVVLPDGAVLTVAL